MLHAYRKHDGQLAHVFFDKGVLTVLTRGCPDPKSGALTWQLVRDPDAFHRIAAAARTISLEVVHPHVKMVEQSREHGLHLLAVAEERDGVVYDLGSEDLCAFATAHASDMAAAGLAFRPPTCVSQAALGTMIEQLDSVKNYGGVREGYVSLARESRIHAIHTMMTTLTGATDPTPEEAEAQLLAAILDRVALGFVHEKEHEGLRLFEYKDNARPREAWHPIDLICRGIVFSAESRCLCYCMPKFFRQSTAEPFPDSEMRIKVKSSLYLRIAKVGPAHMGGAPLLARLIGASQSVADLNRRIATHAFFFDECVTTTQTLLSVWLKTASDAMMSAARVIKDLSDAHRTERKGEGGDGGNGGEGGRVPVRDLSKALQAHATVAELDSVVLSLAYLLVKTWDGDAASPGPDVASKLRWKALTLIAKRMARQA